MKIGYLHIGLPQHGICRYGRLLAIEASKNSNLKVIEANVVLSNNKLQNKEKLILAAQKLSQADIVHIQFSRFNKGLWGEGWQLVANLKTFLSHCSSPIITTIHDVFYPSHGLKNLLNFRQNKNNKTKFLLLELIVNLKRTFENFFEPDLIALRELNSRIKFFIVCSSEEAKRLQIHINPKKIIVIPHFVEQREIELESNIARQELKLTNKKIVTLLGFIYPTKGHELLIEALAELPTDIYVVFAGGASSDKYTDFVEKLHLFARQKKVDRRLRITGYLSETELEKYLVATDLAVCPFSRFSASGSVSTWISVKCPIVASDFPQIKEYNDRVPDAIQTFFPYNSKALAKGITENLAKRDENQLKISYLRQKLLITNILKQHLIYYSQGIEKS